MIRSSRLCASPMAASAAIKYLFFLLLSVFTHTALRAQDPVFSQFYANKPLLNPALTALDEGTALTINYRNLWHKIPGGFQTYSAAAETQWARCARGRLREPIFNFGFGLVAQHDQEGESFLNSNEAHVAASAYHIFKDNGAIHAGVSIGGGQKNLDWNRLTFADQLDGVDGKILGQTTAPLSIEPRFYSDLAAGVALRFGHKLRNGDKESFQSFGISVRHVLGRVESLNHDGTATLPPIFTVHGGLTWPVWADYERGKKYYVYWSPHFQVARQGRFTTYGIGFYGIYRDFMGGMFFRSSNISNFQRHNHVLMFTGGVDLPSKLYSFRMDYSYDLSLSRLASYAGGAHEISFKINLFKVGPGGCKNRTGRGNRSGCPSADGRRSNRL